MLWLVWRPVCVLVDDQEDEESGTQATSDCSLFAAKQKLT